MNVKSGHKAATAVALAWDQRSAPRVTAKGRGPVAERILELANEHDIPLRANRDLVELLAQIDLGSSIPRELYVAVAEVIAFAYALKNELDLIKGDSG